MNARKLPSGRWQSIVYIGTKDGKKIYRSVTADTRKECLIQAAKIQEECRHEAHQLSVGDAVDRYIEAKRGVLSPATVAGYKSKQKLYISSSRIASCRLDQLTPQKMQSWVSEISKGISKKTVKNAYALLTAAVKMFRPKADLEVRLPQGRRYEGYVPSTDEVLRVLDAAKEYDTRLYRACLLSAFATLRRGEIACLTAEDINGSMISITKDMVKDEQNQWVIKLPKTEASVRNVPLPGWVINEMPTEGKLVDYTPDQITTYFQRAVKEAGVPAFRFHDLRKFSVSLMATQGVSMASIKDIGGWSNLQTPTQIYVKSLADAHQREMAQYLAHLDAMKPDGK